MSKVTIEVNGLGKRYSLGQRESYKTLRETLSKVFAAPIRAFSRHGDQHVQPPPEFWALRDASFEVTEGEVVGFIGRNGAGKSTLLKILSRITEPTEGSARMYGRCGSLLEVGTGFHPELSGRENIYLNGAILGMSQTDIQKKFDEIVDFSGIEQFLDTPVKRYSSGMYVRLAFSVAAHLEPEIMIVDEVLAVGDAEFQAKCLGKMGDIASQGRTVLFVSHNMSAVERLCDRALLLDQGRIVDDGPVSEVGGRYLQRGLDTIAERRWPDADKAPQSHAVRLVAVRVRDRDGLTTNSPDIREDVGVEIEYEVKEREVLSPNIQVYDGQGTLAFISNDSYYPEWGNHPRQVGRWKSTCWIPGNLLSEGKYTLGVTVGAMDRGFEHLNERDAVSFEIVEHPGGPSARGTYTGPHPGVVRPMLEWTEAPPAPTTENHVAQGGRS
jgi:lipopolysaccharide transport system ATP-binding protein